MKWLAQPFYGSPIEWRWNNEPPNYITDIKRAVYIAIGCCADDEYLPDKITREYERN